MRIGVIGLGAIGGVVAARLLRAGLDVSLAAGRSAAALRSGGLRVHGEPEVAAKAVGETLPPGRYDLLLLCTRTDDTTAALSSAFIQLLPEGAVVCLQNGLPEEKCAAIVGAQRTLGAVIGWSATASAPGEYRVTGGGRFTLGGSAKKLLEARTVLQHAFPVRLTANLAGARWTKLAMNCALSTLGAVSGLDLGGLAARSDARTLAIRVVSEVAQVAQARQVRLERVAGLDLAWISRDTRLSHALLWLAARRRPRQRSGMLVRLLAGRPAGQLDDLNGAVVRAAGERGLTAPLNQRLVALVRAIERREEKPGVHQLPRLLE